MLVVIFAGVKKLFTGKSETEYLLNNIVIGKYNHLKR